MTVLENSQYALINKTEFNPGVVAHNFYSSARRQAEASRSLSGLQKRVSVQPQMVYTETLSQKNQLNNLN